MEILFKGIKNNKIKYDISIDKKMGMWVHRKYKIS